MLISVWLRLTSITFSTLLQQVVFAPREVRKRDLLLSFPHLFRLSRMIQLPICGADGGENVDV
jgi:hypothetical protein